MTITQFKKGNCLSALQGYAERDKLAPWMEHEGISRQDIEAAIKRKLALINKAKYYVTMNDKFMSGWGLAKGLTNVLIIACDSWEQAEAIERNALKRSEMKYVSIKTKRPSIRKHQYPSWKHWEDMGEIWTK